MITFPSKKVSSLLFATEDLQKLEKTSLFQFFMIIFRLSPNQYGRVETVEDMGYFDFDIVNGNGRLLFFPEKFRVNNFDITFTAYGVKDGIFGVGATALGAM